MYVMNLILRWFYTLDAFVCRTSSSIVLFKAVHHHGIDGLPHFCGRSAGRTVDWDGNTYTVEELTEKSFGDVDIALFSAGGSISKKFAPVASDAGCTVRLGCLTLLKMQSSFDTCPWSSRISAPSEAPACSMLTTALWINWDSYHNPCTLARRAFLLLQSLAPRRAGGAKCRHRPLLQSTLLPLQ